MKVLKIFGVVAGLHVLVFVLILVIPGCSSTGKPAPAPAEVAAKPDPAPSISVPTPASSDTPTITVAATPPADPAAPAGGAFYSPTRPNTAAASALESQPVADVTPVSTYTVSHGDSLWTIAKKNHLKVSELAAANNLKSGTPLRLGQKLIIPGKAPPPAEPTAMPAAVGAGAMASGVAPIPAPKASTDEISYTVKSADTLGSIARHFHERMAQLATDNNISDPAKIRPGQTLKIKPGSAGAKRPSKSTGTARSDAGTTSPVASPAAPPATQDLDAGAAPAGAADVPVIKIAPAADATPQVVPAGK